MIYYKLTIGDAISFGQGWVLPDGAVELPVAEWQTAAEVARQPSPAAEPTPEERLLALKAEAGRVISAVVSTTAQLNLNAAMNVIGAKPTSARSVEERAFAETFAEGHAWIQAVRTRIPALLATSGQTPDGEERWPQPSQAVRDLAAAY